MALVPLQHASRQEIFTALFNLLQTLPPPTGSNQWNTFTQTVKEWTDYDASEQPVMTLARGAQNFILKAPGILRVHFKVALLIYFRADGFLTTNTYPDQVTDSMLDSIEQLFTPQGVDQYLTLGGIVQNCWIDGNIYSDPGINDPQCVILVPISIVV